MTKIEIDIPGALYDFLTALKQFADVDVEEYVRHTLIAGIQGDFSGNLETVLDMDKLREKYCVDEWLKEETP